MKTIAVAFLLAAAFIAAGFVFLTEARRTRNIAAARERLLTLHYDDASAPVEPPRLAVAMLSMEQEVTRQQATASYWRGRFDDLIAQFASVRLDQSDATTDPTLLFTAANARFRTSHPEAGDRQAAVERLDGVIQAYADVLRLDPLHADAAFNYEYVGRLRDAVARARGARAKPAQTEEPPAVDLPGGLTLHGRPGGPPPEVTTEEFKTLTPMSFEEREETDPGTGPAPRRKG